MVKRKYTDRPEVGQISERICRQTYIKSPDFQGYLSLLVMKEIREELTVSNDYGQFRIVGKGWKWLHALPDGADYVVTAMFDEDSRITQFYIDIVLEKGLEDGRIYFDDCYLDIVYIPGKPPLLLDEQELAEALSSGVISKSEAASVEETAHQLLREIKDGSNAIVSRIQDLYDWMNAE